MRLVVQRVTSASVSINDQFVASISKGLLVLVGFTVGDDESTVLALADKLINLRIFADQHGRFSESVIDIDAGILVVPQFTLYADTRKGRRPSFSAALDPQLAELLFDKYLECLKQRLHKVEEGVFGASMQVSLVNDGPMTIILDSNS
ncbi:D-aminoacyl-tRNA deacylase [Pseudomonadota bacterium]